MLLALLTLGAYLSGAIPFGYLLGRARGIDIREHGSRNIGATNVGRVLGRGWGKLCLALDILKGLLPALAASAVYGQQAPSPGVFLAWLLVGTAAVVGHVYPVYLGFRGGKGVATTIGVALGIYPHYTVAMLIALAAYAALRVTTGIVSAGSLALAATFPLALAAYAAARGMELAQHWPLHAVATSLGALIILRHRSNIQRMLRGQELSSRGAEPLRPGGGAPRSS